MAKMCLCLYGLCLHEKKEKKQQGDLLHGADDRSPCVSRKTICFAFGGLRLSAGRAVADSNEMRPTD